MLDAENGKKVTIPEDIKVSLEDVLKENFSPGAIVTIASYLCEPRTNTESINNEVRYLRDVLLSMLGVEEYNNTLDALGL